MAIQKIEEYIDQTLLKPNLSSEELSEFVKEAYDYGFKSCCVNACNVKAAEEYLRHSQTVVCAVVAFPFGTAPISAKIAEALYCVEAGAKEIDYVINIGKVLDADCQYIEREAQAMAKVAHDNGAIVKVILEMCYLNEQQKRIAGKIAIRSGVDFLKTSTGFGPYGATIEDVKLLREIAGPNKGVKASGGIRDYKTAMQFIEAGASRIGTSSGISIVENAGKQQTL